MRWLYGLIGALVGTGTGAVAAVCGSLYFSGGNSMLAGFLALFALAICPLLGLSWGIKAGESIRRHLLDDLYEASRKTRTLYLVRLALGVLGVNVFLANLGWQTFVPPADYLLIANFKQNRETLDRVVTMVRAAKGVERVDDSWYQINGKQAGMKAEHLAEYRDLLKSAGVPRGLQLARDKQGIKFYYWVIGGGATSTTMKGYLYSETPPTPLFPTLDGKTVRVGYHHITGNWYLYYEHFSG